MWDQNIKSMIIASAISGEIEKAKESKNTQTMSESIRQLKNYYPILSDEQIINLLDVFIHVYDFKVTEKASLVATLPSYYKTDALPTDQVIKAMIARAKTIIIVTGYSISEYAEDIIDLLINKSRSGVMVKLFVNSFNIEESKMAYKLFTYLGRFLEVYLYQDEDDMAALHAKTIMVDDTTSLISSANLSYHGLEKNIEIGCLADSREYAIDLHALFSELIKTKKVKKYYKDNRNRDN